MNKCIFMGRLTADPEVKYLNSGTVVARFNLAVNRMPDKSGKVEADFFPVVAFGKQAETIGNYLGKGRQVLLETHARIDSYQDKETGKNRYSTSFVIDRFEFCGSKDDGANRARSTGNEGQGYSGPGPQGNGHESFWGPPPRTDPQPVYQQQSAFDVMGQAVPFDEEIPF